MALQKCERYMGRAAPLARIPFSRFFMYMAGCLFIEGQVGVIRERLHELVREELQVEKDL